MGRVSLGGDDIKSAIVMRGETTGQGQCVGPLQLLVNVLLCYCATGRSRLAADGAWQRLLCGGTRATAFNVCVVLG
jgi:hypothetical protein